MYKREISLSDRIISALTYFTVGWVGFIWLILLHFQKKSASHFLRFNIMQSVFLSLLYVVCYMSCNLIFGILSKIPLIQILISWIQLLLMRPFLFQYSIIQTVIIAILAYLILNSLAGRYPIIYKISNFINDNVM